MLRLLTNYYAPAMYDLGRRETPVVALIKRGQARNEQPAVINERVTWPTAIQPVVKRRRAVAIRQQASLGQRRSPQTTNTERRLADLEGAVVDGMMTATEADREYGMGSTVGRPRAKGQETFAAWLLKRIGELSDREALAAMIEKAHAVQTDCALSQAKRSALMRGFNAKLGKYDPEYVAKLQAALAEIELPPSERVAMLRQKLYTLRGRSC